MSAWLSGWPPDTADSAGFVFIAFGAEAVSQLPNNQTLQPCRFRKTLAIRNRLCLEFQVRRDSGLQNFRSIHGAYLAPSVSK